jgi:hypothetical protein
VQSAEVFELLCDEHGRVEAAFFRHVAEAPPLGRAHRRALPPDRPGVEVGKAEHGPHGGRLACPVRAQEADDLPGRHAERQAIQGRQRSEATAKSFELKYATHRVKALRWDSPNTDPRASPALLNRAECHP